MEAAEVFDLVARTIAVEGPVNAGGTLNLVAGRNLYDYPSGQATPLAPDGNAPPAIAIDSSLLGGMYAGRIAIVSNDLGAGVRMHGQMAATTQNMTLTADGNLVLRNATAAGAIDARSAAGDLDVIDTLHGGAGLTLAAAGSLTNTGSIGSGAALDIDLGADLTNAGSIVSAGAMTLGGPADAPMGHLINEQAGVINAGADLAVHASDLTNDGAAGSAAGALDVALSGALTNRGLLYGGTSAHFRLDGAFTNEDADILAQTDLTVEGLSGERAGDLLNRSGSIEAIAGDLTLKAASVTNKKRAFAVGQTSTSTTTTTGSWGQCCNPSSRTTVTVTTQSATEDSPAAKLLAGADMAIETATLTNEYSQIAANGDLTLTADTATNVGHDLIETTTTRRQNTTWHKDCNWLGFNCDWDPTTTTSTSTSSQTLSSVYGTIEAAGTLTANVTGYLANDAVREGAGQIGLWSGTRPQDELQDKLDLAALSPTALDAGLEALVERAAQFDFDPSPDAPYLLETRPEFVDPSLYLGSDYFLERIGGYDPDVTMKRFGDAHVETRLVEDQIFALTGRRSLAGVTDARVQMQRLYDNAVDAQRTLDLTLGVALAPAQITALTADIVWLERRTVRGQEVLVPRLYLASATVAGIDLASARIHGGRSAVAAATLVNSGRIAGVDGLDIETTNALINRGGALASEGDVDIAAGALFANLSGTVSGAGVWIGADDIVHATAVRRDQYGNGFAERAQQSARIESSGDLTLDAMRSITATGAELEAGGDAVLSAGGDITIEALALERRFEDVFSVGYSRSESLTHTLATVHAGGDLTVEAGGDLTLRGAELDAGGDAELTAGGAVTLASVQDRYNDDLKIDIDGGLLGSDVSIRRQSAGAQTRRTTVTAGGALTVRADTGDLTLDAARVQSEGETSLEAAQGQVALLSETDSSFERDYERRESLVWYSETDEGHYEETIVHVEVEAGGGLRITAGEGVVVEYHTTGSLDASLAQLSQSPGLEWVEQLRNDPSVDWRGVEAAFEQWDYEAEGLTQAGAALVTLVAVTVGGPALGKLSASMATSLGITSAAMQAALAAGLKTLASQAAVALVNHQGNLDATLKQLGSSASLKSLATAMVAAGLTVGVSAELGIDVNSKLFTDRLQANLVRATVRAGVSTAIEGGELDDALAAALRTAAADTLGQVVAGEIGDNYLSAAGDGIDPFEYGLHKAMHAALGCAAATVGGNDCASAAVGAAAGEIYAESVSTVQAADLAAQVQADELSFEDAVTALQDQQDDLVARARVAAAIAAIAAGADSAADINAAADAGANAVEHNLCGTGVCIGAILLGGMLYAAIVGDGDAGEGLALIGDGDDPLGRALASGTESALKWSAKEFPETTETVLSVLEATGGAIDVTITYLDDATDNEVSGQWNELDPRTRSQLVGAGKIVSIALPAGSVKVLQRLKFGKAPTGRVDPSQIRFSQDSIRDTFKDGRTVQDLVTGLKNGSIRPEDVPPIRTVEINGQLISIDNRRLAAFREARMPIRTIPATAQEIADAQKVGKFSAGPSGSDTIRIRGQ